MKAAGVCCHRTMAGGSKTVCTSWVLAALGIDKARYHYSGKPDQIKSVLRRAGYAVRSRLSRLPRGCSVGRSRSRISTWDDPTGVSYVVWVSGHLLMLDSSGATAVDTSPRKRDRRVVLGVWAVYNK
jgi:hypothetical protein